MNRSRSFRHLPLIRRIGLAALAATALLVAGNAQALLIDDFNDSTPVVCNPGGCLPTEYDGAVGGWRAYSFGANSTNSTQRVLGGVYEHEADNASAEAIIIWDGVPNSGSFDPIQDFTDGGASDVIQLVLSFPSILGFEEEPTLEFQIRTHSPGSSVIIGTHQFSPTESGVWEVPLDVTHWGGLDSAHLDFTNVITLQLQVVTGDALSVTIDNIATVPEPGTALLMGLGLAGLAAGGRSQRQARV